IKHHDKPNDPGKMKYIKILHEINTNALTLPKYKQINDIEYDNMIGKINYSYEFDSMKNLLSQTRKKIDYIKNITIIEKSHYDGGRNIIGTVKETLNSSGELISCVVREHVNNKVITVSVKQKFDTRGQLIQKIEKTVNGDVELNRYSQPDKTVTTNQEFDTNGNLILKTEEIANNNLDVIETTETRQQFDSNGNLLGKVIAKKTFNDDGLPLDLEEEFDSNDKLTGKTITKHENGDYFNSTIVEKFDGQGTLIGHILKKKEFDDDYYVIRESEESHDGVGRLIEKTIIEHDVESDFEFYTKTIEKFNSDKELTFFSRYKYDANGRIVEDLSGPDKSNRAKSDQLVSAINCFGTNEGVAAPVDKISMPTINSSMLVAPL
ncbi:hypothetical protein, partial [Yersinia bercovieri]|uniref:hypothetical protein n=1 Tax=Yersinia bercovieri TaxID=634 RepID=UPI00164374C4